MRCRDQASMARAGIGGGGGGGGGTLHDTRAPRDRGSGASSALLLPPRSARGEGWDNDELLMVDDRMFVD